MSLSLTDVRRIAADVAREQHPELEVMGATTEGSADYAELIVRIRRCRAEPCRIVFGISRNASERELRSAIRLRFDQRRHKT